VKIEPILKEIFHGQSQNHEYLRKWILDTVHYKVPANLKIVYIFEATRVNDKEASQTLSIEPKPGKNTYYKELRLQGK
jgi:hypothetical protein